MTIKYSASIIGNRLASVNTDIGANAVIRIYNAPRPANVATAVTSQTVLAGLVGNATAFGTVSGGTLTANAITGDASADNTGTAAWARIFKADGTTACMDCDVAASGADLNLSSVSITATQPVNVTSFVITGAPV